MAIEVEVRSFVAEQKYEQLLDFFRKHAQLVKEDNQETWYFTGNQDFRMQRNDFGAKLVLKKGKVHDPHREEHEVEFSKESFGSFAEMFSLLGFEVDMKWFRKRYEFLWDGIRVCLDNTKGYGCIIELERLCNNTDKSLVYTVLQQKLMNLDVPITPREEFEQRFQEYKENWRDLIKI
ncbi:MAG TPA: CYTH domain-containing protein [Candidatus Nanoarchaeia archaeon]|nr:CYTH domain-containing protein [Candidatus Nanoarchaeia archaeon]